ncbi:MAG: ATP-binding cassette domain-containing protein [Gammaproteobacteria bacterium]|nr:ATP-binding cassette domain-containing protein [Gammaproteobacteria bacterium]
MITLSKVELLRGAKLLFSDANVSFYDRQKIGVVGKNGSGKTSLFLLLQRILDPTAGDVSLSEKLRIVTVEQEIPQSDRGALEYVIDADVLLRKCQDELTTAEANHDGMKIAELYEALQNIDGFTAETRAAKILTGLGFNEEEMAAAVNTLSGGWRMRLNIARTLLIPSEVLLLDEPTNHLDLDAVIWLEKWLKQYQGLLLFISHDREFLDKIADNIVHIENKQIKNYSGNYSSFERQRVSALAQQQQQYEKQQRQAEHMKDFIRRFKAKATKARQAQSRVKALERMQEIMPAHVDSPFSFEFKEPKYLANPLLSLQQIGFGYTEKQVLESVDFQLNTQDRAALLGRNGAGKSTLIKLLAGELTVNSGEVIRNKNLKIGYFAQHTLERLDGDKSPLQNLQKIATDKTQGELRKFLGGFDFRGDMALMTVKNLSGGEKARLALALIVWQAPNVLLLDEPTNHLDLDMRQALILALQSYEGAVVLVSHDRFLLKQVIDDYWLIADKKVQHFPGDLNAYQDYLLKSDKVGRSSKKVGKQNNQKQLAAMEKNIDKLQRQITDIELKISELGDDSINNMAELERLDTKRATLVKQYEEHEEQWLQLADVSQ